jgi:gliding motility-associated-like protein
MMRKILLTAVTALTLFLIPAIIFGQAAPNLGTASTFVLFSSNGAVTHVGAGIGSHITGNVGSDIGGPSSGFGNIDGQMHDNDAVTAAAVTDLNNAYLNLNSQGPATVHGILLGGETIFPGIYSLTGISVLGGVLTLDGQGQANPYFLFKINGDFSANASSEVKLINGAKACNIYWVVEGTVGLATGTKMRGNIISHNGAITIATGVTLEGRALTTNGSVTVNTGLTAYTPLGCGSPFLTGPVAPNIGSTACYALLTGNGAMKETGTSAIIGDVGSDGGGTITGYTAAMITGTLHPVHDASTIQASADLGVLSNYLQSLPYDIQLLYPADFGHELVLTPHVYWMSSAPLLTDTVFLNAEGNPNAVFVFKIDGAVTTGTYANVVLLNGAQSSNVFWLVNNASVDISGYSTIRGTIVVNIGAISLALGDTIDGRALTTNGAITTSNVNMTINSAAPSITPNGPTTFCQGDSVTLMASNSSSYAWSNGKSTQSITVYTSGNYSVVLGNSCGTSSSPPAVMVTVNPVYTKNISASICNGDSLFIKGAYRTLQGTYSDTLTTTKGCDSIIVTTLSIKPLAVAGFNSTLSGQMNYSFANTSTNATSYAWDFGDGQTSTSVTPAITYTSSGTYTVRLIASNSCGPDTIKKVIVVLDLEFFNGFSPNGDAHNDNWQIPVLTYNPNNSVQIINRWGDEVWVGLNYDNKTVVWTGQNMKDADLPDGNYYYIIKYDKVEKRGWVFVKR